MAELLKLPGGRLWYCGTTAGRTEQEKLRGETLSRMFSGQVFKARISKPFFFGKEQQANDANTCHDICLHVSEKRWFLEARCLIKDLLTPQRHAVSKSVEIPAPEHRDLMSVGRDSVKTFHY